MKRIVIINGSPRKRGNTATLLKSAMDGALSQGVTAEFVNLYDLNYRGCISCLSCKRRDGKHNCTCAMKDDLSPVLNKVMKSDGVIIGSPIYFHNITGMTRSFLERLFFMNGNYDNFGSNFTGNIPVSFIYTMNLNKEMANTFGYNKVFEQPGEFVNVLNGGNGKFEYLLSADTNLFPDYEKYAAKAVDQVQKIKVKTEQFPKDCQSAFEMGKRMAM